MGRAPSAPHRRWSKRLLSRPNHDWPRRFFAAEGPRGFLYLFSSARYAAPMPDAPERLTPATPEDVADALAFALRFQGRKRVHNADELISKIVAKRLVEHLERSGFVVMKRPPIGAAAALGRGFEGDPGHGRG